MFDKNSCLVRIWADLIKNGTYKKEDVPDLYDLKEAVEMVMEEENGL